MEPATVTVTLTPADYRRFSEFAIRPLKRMRRGLIMASIALALPTAVWMYTLYRHFHPSRYFPAHPFQPGQIIASVVLLLIWLLIFFSFWVRSHAFRPKNIAKSSPGALLPNTFTVLDKGLFCQGDRGETLSHWTSVARFTETQEDFFVILAERNGYVFPKRCFPSLEAAAVFANQVRLHLEKHTPAALSPTPAG
jgi:hypothetical protein